MVIISPITVSWIQNYTMALAIYIHFLQIIKTNEQKSIFQHSGYSYGILLAEIPKYSASITLSFTLLLSPRTNETDALTEKPMCPSENHNQWPKQKKF